jgi:hypothetical protein
VVRTGVTETQYSAREARPHVTRDPLNKGKETNSLNWCHNSGATQNRDYN